MPIDLVIDEREGGTKLEGLPGENNSNPDLRTLTSSSKFRAYTSFFAFFLFEYKIYKQCSISLSNIYCNCEKGI